MKKMSDFLTNLFPKKIDEEFIRNSEAFCMNPWVHLFVTHTGNVVPCCLTPWNDETALGNLKKDQLKDVWNGVRMREFRAKMLKDQKDKRCGQCYESEKFGLKSTRQFVNFLYADKLDWVQTTQSNGYAKYSKPIYWDIRWSNVCNLKCRICGHHSSSKWYDDALQLNETNHDTRIVKAVDNFDDFLSEIEEFLPNLEEVYFAGGEPLYMDEHYAILEKLIELKKTNIKLRYSTNFSKLSFKNWEVIPFWKKFDNIFIHASLDGIEDKVELQRSGLRWDEVLKNRILLKKECPQIDFMITPTINVFNILHLPEFHNKWVKEGLIKIDDFMPHTLRDPDIYNIQILPRELKLKVEKNIREHVEWIKSYALKNPPMEESGNPDLMRRLEWIKGSPITGFIKLDIIIREFESCIDFMNSADTSHLIPKLVEKSQALDKLRNEDTLATFPELSLIFSPNQKETP